MGEDKQEKPKIIIDDDWKTQAQAEKERLAKEVEQKPSAGAPGVGPGEAGAGAEGEPREIPPASFSTLVSFLATQILMSLGGYQDPQTKRRYVDLDLAKHYIDTLAMLEEKTKGNLTEEEKKLLDQVLYETRMQYVQIAQRVSQV